MHLSPPEKPPGFTFPAPFDAAWSYRQRPATDLNIVKAARAAIVWRANKGFKAFIQAGRYLGWVVRFPKDLIWYLVSHNLNVRNRLGRSFSAQIVDMVRVATVNGVMPRDYYDGGLAHCRGGEELFRYVPHHLYHTVANQLTIERTSGETQDKYAFECRCRDTGLPVVRTIAIADPAAVRLATGETLSGSQRSRDLANEAEILTPTGDVPAGLLPDRDLIIKPIIGRQGSGIEMWLSDGPGRFANVENGSLSGAELLTRASSLASARGCAMLLQERSENHPDIQQIAGSALSTMRIGTMFNEHGEPEVVDAAYRTSTAPHAAVNNFHAGGMGFPIEVATGVLCPGVWNGPYDPSSPITHHPQTGARVAGLTHPAWHASAELALRLHRMFPDLVMPGWDIAFDKNGPIIIEGNGVSGISITRQPPFGGLVGTRTLTLLAYHASQWLERNEPERSRWRFSKNGTHPRRTNVRPDA